MDQGTRKEETKGSLLPNLKETEADCELHAELPGPNKRLVVREEKDNKEEGEGRRTLTQGGTLLHSPSRNGAQQHQGKNR